MSTTQQTTIWCDESDCEEWWLIDGTARDARGYAKQHGWVVRRGGFDFCPRHSGHAETPSEARASGSSDS